MSHLLLPMSKGRKKSYLPAVDVLVQVNGVLTSDNVVDGRTLGTLGFLGHFYNDIRFLC
jgi:hypothetical protein